MRGVEAYIIAVNLLAAILFQDIVHLIHGKNFVVGKNHLVQSARIGDNTSHPSSDIPQVGNRRRRVPVPCYTPYCKRDGIVDASRRETG